MLGTIAGAVLLACDGRSSAPHRAQASGAAAADSGAAGDDSEPASAGLGGMPSDMGGTGSGDAARSGSAEVAGLPGVAGSSSRPPTDAGGAPAGGGPPVAGTPSEVAGAGAGLAGAPTAGAPGSFGYCVYDFVAHGPNETFLARDGCNTCIGHGDTPVCTDTACVPDCEHQPIGRICLVGEWDGGEREYFEVGAPLIVQLQPAGCISAWCNDTVIASCSIADEGRGGLYTVTGDFCTHFVDRMLCDDCGSFSARCEAPALIAGTYTFRVAGFASLLELSVPSSGPPLSHCIDVTP